MSKEGTAKKLHSFFESDTEQYAILQLSPTEDTALELYSSIKELGRMGLEPNINHYDVVYIAPLPKIEVLTNFLEDVFVQFNIACPEDFTGHSLSVSDIVAIKKKGAVSFHFVDSVGFKELSDFIKVKEN